jgi:hypothetical protein
MTVAEQTTATRIPVVRSYGGRDLTSSFSRTALRICCFIAIGLIVSCSTGPQSTATTADADIVYCTASENRPLLIEAGVALSLLQMQSTPLSVVADADTFRSVDDWRAAMPADFARSCNALRAAQSPAPASSSPAIAQPAPALLSTLAPVALGAVLTLMITEIRSIRDRNRAEASIIREKAASFVNALADFSRAWSKPTVLKQPTTDAVYASRQQLLVVLRQASELRPRWKLAKALAEIIDQFESESIAGGWAVEQDERLGRARRLQGVAAQLSADIEIMARALELGIVNRYRTRAAMPTATFSPNI